MLQGVVKSFLRRDCDGEVHHEGMKQFLRTDCDGKVHHEGDEVVSEDGLRWRSAS